MEAQIDVLEGKRRALTRFRDATRRIASELGELATQAATTPSPAARPAGTGTMARVGDDEASSMQSTRSILGAQEELRRQIARSLHDGPVQGLTNIALQAQIVERLAVRSPERAADEAKALVAMVQSTLDTTKSFLFDVRPMVLDDLGLVPTLRRMVRESSRRATATVELDSSGQDQRLPSDVESGMFRIVDDAMAAYLDTRADRVSIRLEWTDQLSIVVSARREPGTDDEPEIAPPKGDVPPALAAMIEDRRLARRPHIAPETLLEIQARASAVGAVVSLHDEGSELRVSVPIAGRP
jgi:two-component system sensor histidine kinase DegS